MMGKLAFVFPGQGSQYVGMGRELAGQYQVVRDVFTIADRVLGRNLSELCFEGPEERLKSTENTQPAIFTTSVAISRLLQEEGIVPTHVAGHSLGEYTALVAAGVMELETALEIVDLRGKWMAEAVPPGEGSMLAVLGLDREQVEAICTRAGSVGVVGPANYNCPGQIVISGQMQALDLAAELSKTAGAKRVLPLNVSGPFHSRLMRPAGEKLEQVLQGAVLSAPRCKFFANVTGCELEKVENIRKALVDQVSSPVRWEQIVEGLIEEGVNKFVEVGPGKVLSGLIKKICREAVVFNVEDGSGLETIKGGLKGVGSNA